MSLSDILNNGQEPWKAFYVNSIDTKTLTVAGSAVTQPVVYNFTINWTGPITISTNARAIKIGNMVSVTFPTTTAAGNNVAAIMASQANALPADLRLTTALNLPLLIVTNAATVVGYLNIVASGGMGIQKENGGNFDASSIATGFNGFCFSYAIV